MVQTGYPFGPRSAVTGARTMTENQWTQMMRYILGTGIISVSFQDQLNQAVVTPGATPLTVDVDTGAAWIQGHYWQSDATISLSISQNISALTRADLVVIECKWGLDAGVAVKVVEGTPGAVWPVKHARAGSPMPPTPYQVYGTRWQLPLAQVNTTTNKSTVYAAADIVDWRSFVNSGGAKSSTYVVASAAASPLIRANADAVVPFGSLNAEETINEAISTVSGYATSGGTVLLSEGLFNTSASINMLPNVSLKGLGTKSIIQYNLGVGGTNNAPVIACDAVDNVTIADLSIDGGGAPLVDLTPVSEVAGYDGIGISNGTFNVVRNCTIQHCKARGIVLASSDPSFESSFGHRVEGCYVGDCVSSGIHIESNGGIFTNNQVNHNGYGVYLFSSSGTGGYGASMNIISNNNIRLSLYTGLVVEAGSASSSGGCMRNILNHNIVYNSNRNNSTYSNIKVTGAYAKYNMFEANFSQHGNSTPYPVYAFYLDNLNDYNFITGNYLYGAHFTAELGGTLLGAGHNRFKYNFTDTAATEATNYGASGYKSYPD